jgi:hypothetical protein
MRLASCRTWRRSDEADKVDGMDHIDVGLGWNRRDRSALCDLGERLYRDRLTYEEWVMLNGSRCSVKVVSVESHLVFQVGYFSQREVIVQL